MTRSGWFRRQQTLLESSGTSTAKRGWLRTRVFSASGPSKRRGTALVASGAAAVLVAGVMVVAFASPGSHASAMSAVASANRTAVIREKQPAADLQVVSVAPAAGAKGINGANPIRVQFSAPLAASSPMPTLSPQIAGNWTVRGDAAVFTPTVGYFENTRVTVKIPAGLPGVISAAGVRAGGGGTLSSAMSVSFTTGSFSTMRLQQLLAELGYLPMTWTPMSGTGVNPGSAHAQLAAAYNAPAGTFSWQGGYPWNLTSQWQAGWATYSTWARSGPSSR